MRGYEKNLGRIYEKTKQTNPSEAVPNEGELRIKENTDRDRTDIEQMNSEKELKRNNDKRNFEIMSDRDEIKRASEAHRKKEREIEKKGRKI